MNFLTVGLLLAICGSLVEARGWDHKDQGHSLHPRYEFGYGVKDLQTGDIKDQWEQRDGDHVRGSYSLREADGTIRVVEYYVDGQSGFHATVKKFGLAQHPAAAAHHHGQQGQHKHQGHDQATSFINVNHY